MITEQYVGYETAKLLKDKGFDVYTETRYDETGGFHHEGYYLVGNDDISAPTQALVMRWLREAHNFHIVIEPAILCESGQICYTANISDISNKEMFMGGRINIESKATYEEACEAAIIYCLTNLL